MNSKKIRSYVFVAIAPAVLTAAGCATASSTTAMVSAQVQQNRGLLALEQANTRQLTSQKASLQKQLSALTQRRDQIQARSQGQGDSSGSGDELRQINQQIAALKAQLTSN